MQKEAWEKLHLCLKIKKIAGKLSGLKHPWAPENKIDLVDKAIISTIKMFQKNYQTLRKNKTEDEEQSKANKSLFCSSLVSKLKRLPPHLLTQTQFQIL